MLDELPETRVAVISARAAAQYSGLEEVVGLMKQVGKRAWIAVLPERGGIEDILAPLMSESNVVFLEYGDKADFAGLEQAAAGLSGFQFSEQTYSLEGPNVHAILLQIIADLAGMEESRISEEALMDLEAGLGIQM